MLLFVKNEEESLLSSSSTLATYKMMTMDVHEYKQLSTNKNARHTFQHLHSSHNSLMTVGIHGIPAFFSKN